jgi:hypothetical protein
VGHESFVKRYNETEARNSPNMVDERSPDDSPKNKKTAFADSLFVVV